MILKEHGPQLTLTGDYAYSALLVVRALPV